MKLPVILRPSAEAEVRLIYEYLEKSQVVLGDRFVACLRDVLEQIEDMPELYGLVNEDIRAARIRKFRYLIYYLIFNDRVEVLAVLHSSRDESVWQSRS